MAISIRRIAKLRATKHRLIIQDIFVRKKKRKIIIVHNSSLEKRRVQVRVSATLKFTEFTSCAESEIAEIRIHIYIYMRVLRRHTLRRQLE